METIAKFTRFSYKRKLCQEDRATIVVLYEEGYAISRIAVAVKVRTHSIRHHLMAMGVLEKHRTIKRWGQDAQLSPHGEAIDAVPKHLPPHIQEVYRKMYIEDDEMRRRLQPRRSRNKRIIMHKAILAADPRKFEKKPFKLAYSIII